MALLLSPSNFEHTGVFEGFIRNERGKRRLILRLDDGERYEFKVDKELRRHWEDRLVRGAVVTLSGIGSPSRGNIFQRLVLKLDVLSSPAGTTACERCPIKVCSKKNCWRSGGRELWDLLEQRIDDKDLAGEVELKDVGCLGNCKRAPNIGVGKKLHERCTAGDVEEILERIALKRAAR